MICALALGPSDVVRIAPLRLVLDEVLWSRDLADVVVVGADASEQRVGADGPTGRLGEIRDGDRMCVRARRLETEPLHQRTIQIGPFEQGQIRLDARSDQEVVFTYGTTSSINLLAHCFGTLLQSGDEILLSVLEHHSNLVPWQTLAKQTGIILRFLPITPAGRLDLDWLNSELTPRCRLVALTHCSNVTGAASDVGRLTAAARVIGAKVMLDGAQRTPHGPIDVQQLDVDFYAFSGHKTYGPTGIGVLWGRRELLDAMPPFMTGGQMIAEVTSVDAAFRPPPRRFEAGTPPIAAAVGLGAALEWMQSLDWCAAQDHERQPDAPARRVSVDFACAGTGPAGYPRTARRSDLFGRRRLR